MPRSAPNYSGGPLAQDHGYERLIDAVRDRAICMLDTKGNIESWNAGAERLYGYSADEIVGQHVSCLYLPELRDRQTFESDLEAVARADFAEDESWRIRKDGSHFWAHVSMSTIRDPNGELIGFASVTRDVTERRVAEATRAELGLLVANVTDYAIFMLDPYGFVLTWNAGAERIEGYLASEVIGKHFSTFYPPEDIREQKPARELEEAKRVGRVEDEGWRLRKDGTRFWANVVMTALYNPERKLLGYAKITRDLTEKRRAEETARRLEMERVARDAAERAETDAKRHATRLAALVSSEAQARQLAENAAMRMARLQATTAALAEALTPADAGNATMEQGLGLFGAFGGSIFLVSADRQRLELLTAHGHGPEFAAELGTIPLSAKTPVAACARTGRTIVFSSRAEIAAKFPDFRAKNVDRQTEAALLLPLVTKGVVLGVVILNFADPRTFDEEDLRYAGLVAQQSAQAIDRAYLVEEQRRSTERANFLAEASSLLGVSVETQAVLEGLAKLMVPRIADWCAIELSDAEALPVGLDRVIQSGQAELHSETSPELLSTLVSNPSTLASLGHVRQRSAIVVPLMARGRSVAAIALVSSESKPRYTAFDLDFVTEIARRAALAVENARLYREQQAAVQARDDFLAVAGHELKTPLAALLLHVQSVQRAARRDPSLVRVAERIDKAVSSGGRLEKLIDQLLDVSRITTGRLRLDPEPVELGELVEQVAGRFADAAAKSETPLEVIAMPVSGIWDRMRVEQLVSNLLANALKYGRGKPVEIAVNRIDSQALITVTDHGIGIAPEKQQKIFERFERAVANREFGGFGLGLWISRQIVEAFGGTIRVESEPGSGAKFTVSLPIAA